MRLSYSFIVSVELLTENYIDTYTTWLQLENGILLLPAFKFRRESILPDGGVFVCEYCHLRLAMILLTPLFSAND